MGCGKICKAKKKAKNAKKQADKAKYDAVKQQNEAMREAQKAARNGTTSVVTIKSYTIEVVTIGKFLGVDSKKNALSIRDMINLFNVARKSPEIMASAVAKNLIGPLLGFFDFYAEFTKLIRIFQQVKPWIKIAMQIGDIVTFNFAAVGELLSDVAQMLAQLMLGFAPLLIELLKNIFLSIPLYINKIPKEQKIRIQGLLALKHIEIREEITNAIKDYKGKKPFCTGRATPSCPEIITTAENIKAAENEINLNIESYTQHAPFPPLESLTDVTALRTNITEYMKKGMKCTERDVLKNIVKASKRKNIPVSVLPGIEENTPEEKLALGQAVDGLQTAYEKTEAAIAEELLRQNFAVSQILPEEENERYSNIMLAEVLANNSIAELRKVIVSLFKKFNNTNGTIYPRVDLCRIITYELNKEAKKKLKKIEKGRQDIITLTVTTELMQSNKIQIIDNVIKSLSGIGFDSSSYSLDNSITDQLNNDFNNLKNNMKNDNVNDINNAVVNNTNDMLDLRDLIMSNINNNVNDENIVPDPNQGLSDSVSSNLEQFKSELVLSVENNMRKTYINMGENSLPSYTDKKKVNDMVKVFYSAIIDEIVGLLKNLVLESAIPCKACRPSEKMVEDLIAFSDKRLNEQKDAIIKNSEEKILDASLDWTITDANSVAEKKQQLIDMQEAGIDENIGSVNLYDIFILKLRQEEEAILDNVSKFIRSSVS